jgi:hypothetical protein
MVVSGLWLIPLFALAALNFWDWTTSRIRVWSYTCRLKNLRKEIATMEQIDDGLSAALARATALRHFNPALAPQLDRDLPQVTRFAEQVTSRLSWARTMETCIEGAIAIEQER